MLSIIAPDDDDEHDEDDDDVVDVDVDVDDDLLVLLGTSQLCNNKEGD